MISFWGVFFRKVKTFFRSESPHSLPLFSCNLLQEESCRKKISPLGLLIWFLGRKGGYGRLDVANVNVALGEGNFDVVGL